MLLANISWTPEAIIALCALIVSTVSVLFTVKTLSIQREHNYKSVKPIGMIVVADYENKIFIRLDNCGIGPLIITEVTVKNKNLTASTVIDILPSNLNERITWRDFAAGLESKTISAGKSIDLIVWECDEESYEQQKTINDRKDLRNALKDITITFEYTDVYEKHFFKVERSLEWFGRHLS